MLLHNCYSEISKNCMFDSRAHGMVKYLQVYKKSTNESISFNAQCLLLNLSPFLIEADRKLLSLSAQRIADIFHGLRQAIASPFLNAALSCGVSLSLYEFVSLLNDAASLKENIESMVQNKILGILITLIELTNRKVVESSLLLMWLISMHKDVNEVIKKDSGLITKLRSCSHKLSKTVLLSIYVDIIEGEY